MQSELCVSRQVSSKLREQIVSLERKCWSNCQHSRRECLELNGPAQPMENSQLEDTALKFFKNLDVEIDSSGCQLQDQKESLLNFPNETVTISIRRGKKNLKGMHLSSIGIRSLVL